MEDLPAIDPRLIESADAAVHAVRIGTDPADLDVDWIHAALSERAYWALGRSRDVVERSIRNSVCFGAFDGERQVGFARVVTDQATFGWVCDVFIDEAWRGQGIGSQLIKAIVADPRLFAIRMLLATRDAHEVYRRQGGFQALANPERLMERPRRP